MINIFYSYQGGGPKKVKDNLILGLNLCNIKYTENQFIYENSIFLSDTAEMKTSKDLNKIIVGPNVWPFSDEWVLSQKYAYYITPSSWVKDMLVNKANMLESKIKIWPVGINTEVFKDFSKEKKTNDFLIYFKRRNTSDLQSVCNFLKSKNLTFQIIKYGGYTEQEMIDLAKISKGCFVINGTESQGIAIEELMSCNLPMLVWDIDFWNDMGESYRAPATSVPYWSDECGIKIIDYNEIEEKFDFFLKTVDNYSPRNYILRELSLEKQALELVKMFEN